MKSHGQADRLAQGSSRLLQKGDVCWRVTSAAATSRSQAPRKEFLSEQGSPGRKQASGNSRLFGTWLGAAEQRDSGKPTPHGYRLGSGERIVAAEAGTDGTFHGPVRLSRIVDPRQQRIHQRLLRLVGPGPAAFFKDACWLMGEGPPLEATAHLVAHLLREVEGSLREVLETEESRHRREASRGPCQEGLRHEESVRAALKALDIDESDPVALLWLDFAKGRDEYRLHRWAHRSSLAGVRRASDPGFQQMWNRMLSLLDAVLDRFEARYTFILELVDRLVSQGPRQEAVSELRSRVPHNPVTLRYLFEKLTDPRWLRILEEAGLFRYPPAPEYDPDHGTVGFPPWPASQYLARMAKVAEAQPDVLRIALTIPETDNVRIHEDLADVALALPPEMAANCVPLAEKWVASTLSLLLPEKLGALVVHLADGGQEAEALRLARSLYDVVPEERRSGPQGEHDPLGLRLPEPRPRFDPWVYEEVLKTSVPVLARRAREQSISLLCDILEKAIGLMGYAKPPYDGSFIWRPAIEEHRRNPRFGVASALVSALRDAAEATIADDPQMLRAVNEVLMRRPWAVFRRLMLHLLRRFANLAPDLVVQWLTDRTCFSDPAVHHEYFLLLSERFGMLSEAQRGTILSWIESGPDLRAFKKRWEELRGAPPTDEEIRRHTRLWQLERLACIATVLPPQWRAYYEQLAAELGAPEHPEFLVWTSTWVGPVSPMSTDELLAMSVEEVVRFLQTWQPTGGWKDPTPEGLGRTLAQAVAQQPERYADEADRFKGLEPTYVRAFFSGLREATAKGRPFSWAKVLDLASWVLRQPRNFPGPHRQDLDRDPDWSWTRKTIADLLAEGLKAGPSEIPVALRTEVWTLLTGLTEDPDPTPEYEERLAGSETGPAELSLNTVRGAALHAVMGYLLWVRRHLQSHSGTPGGLPRGLEDAPEVREVLEAHLDPLRESCVSVRAVYGMWLPHLVSADTAWVTSQLDRIFPKRPGQEHLRDAAWKAYILFCQPSHRVFECIKAEYSAAVDRLASMQSNNEITQYERGLAEHLMILYWTGELDLGESNALLTRFYALASDPLRAHAVAFIGRSLAESQDEVPQCVIHRLERLWEARVEAAQAAVSVECFTQELANFGWWYISGRFNQHWALDQLARVIELVGTIDPDDAVLERLVPLASVKPREVIKCLAGLVKGAPEPWVIGGWRNEAKAILRAVLSSKDEQAKTIAEEVINRLVARGFVDFRPLLGDSSRS